MFAGLIPPIQLISPAGGGQATADVRQTLHLADRTILHLARIDLRLKLTITAAEEAGDDPGAQLCQVLDEFLLRDINGDDVVRLGGNDLRTFIKQCQGWRYADPAAVVAGSGAQTRDVLLTIPFHGASNGLLGYTKFTDLIQPMDRFRETVLTATFNWGAIANGTVTAAILDVTMRTVPYRHLIQGADVRYGYINLPDQQTIEVPQVGLALHTIGMVNLDRTHADYATVTVPEYSMYSNVEREQLVMGWNAHAACSADQHEAIGACEFLPLLYQSRFGSPQWSMRFAGQKAIFRTLNTNATVQRLAYCQLWDTEELVKRLRDRGGTIYNEVRGMKAQYGSKNRANVSRGDAGVANRLDRVLPQKLYRK